MNVDVEAVVREYIDKSLHMSLATVSGDRPWVSEVHFAYDNDLNLYYRSLASRRHSLEIADNPYVAGNIVRQHALGEYPEAVYFEGKAEQVTDESQFAELFTYFNSRQDVAVEIIENAKQEDGHKFYKIKVENWYAFGKFGGEKGQKYKLAWNGGLK